MGHILARIKTRKAANLRIVMSNVEAYDIPELDNVTDYNDELKLDDGQWFRITDFSQKNYCPDYLKLNLNLAELATISRAEFDKINYLISLQNDNLFLFQRLFTSSVIEKQNVLSFQDEPQLKKNQSLVIVNAQPDAIYSGNTNILYFKDLAKITPIFKGIDVLFQEATDDEVDDFLGLDLVSGSSMP